MCVYLYIYIYIYIKLRSTCTENIFLFTEIRKVSSRVSGWICHQSFTKLGDYNTLWLNYKRNNFVFDLRALICSTSVSYFTHVSPVVVPILGSVTYCVLPRTSCIPSLFQITLHQS